MKTRSYSKKFLYSHSNCHYNKFKKHFGKIWQSSEDGRSMVEMLGVLAVVGVLSVGGITAYKKAMQMHYANTLLNEVSKRAVVVSGQINLGQEPSLSGFNNQNVIDGVSFTGITPRDTTFEITATGVKTPVCGQMKQIINESSAIHIKETCESDSITFGFNNDLSAVDFAFEKTAADCLNESSSNYWIVTNGKGNCGTECSGYYSAGRYCYDTIPCEGTSDWSHCTKEECLNAHAYWTTDDSGYETCSSECYEGSGYVLIDSFCYADSKVPCTSGYVGNCNNQPDCLANGGKWAVFENTCSETCPSGYEENNGNCTITGDNCKNASGYWYHHEDGTTTCEQERPSQTVAVSGYLYDLYDDNGYGCPADTYGQDVCEQESGYYQDDSGSYHLCAWFNDSCVPAASNEPETQSGQHYCYGSNCEGSGTYSFGNYTRNYICTFNSSMCIAIDADTYNNSNNNGGYVVPIPDYGQEVCESVTTNTTRYSSGICWLDSERASGTCPNSIMGKEICNSSAPYNKTGKCAWDSDANLCLWFPDSICPHLYRDESQICQKYNTQCMFRYDFEDANNSHCTARNPDYPYCPKDPSNCAPGDDYSALCISAGGSCMTANNWGCPDTADSVLCNYQNENGCGIHYIKDSDNKTCCTEDENSPDTCRDM